MKHILSTLILLLPLTVAAETFNTSPHPSGPEYPTPYVAITGGKLEADSIGLFNFGKETSHSVLMGMDVSPFVGFELEYTDTNTFNDTQAGQVFVANGSGVVVAGVSADLSFKTRQVALLLNTHYPVAKHCTVFAKAGVSYIRVKAKAVVRAAALATNGVSTGVVGVLASGSATETDPAGKFVVGASYALSDNLSVLGQYSTTVHIGTEADIDKEAFELSGFELGLTYRF